MEWTHQHWHNPVSLSRENERRERKKQEPKLYNFLLLCHSPSFWSTTICTHIAMLVASALLVNFTMNILPRRFRADADLWRILRSRLVTHPHISIITTNHFPFAIFYFFGSSFLFFVYEGSFLLLLLLFLLDSIGCVQCFGYGVWLKAIKRGW